MFLYLLRYTYLCIYIQLYIHIYIYIYISPWQLISFLLPLAPSKPRQAGSGTSSWRSLLLLLLGVVMGGTMGTCHITYSLFFYWIGHRLPQKIVFVFFQVMFKIFPKNGHLPIPVGVRDCMVDLRMETAMVSTHIFQICSKEWGVVKGPQKSF